MRQLRPTITRKFLLLLLGFLALQLLQLGAGIYGKLRIEQQSALINATSELRVQALALGILAREAVGETQGATQARQKLAADMLAYRSGLSALEERLTGRGDDHAILALIDEVQRAWDQSLGPRLREVQGRAPIVAGAAQARYDALVPDQVDLLHRIVRVLEQEARERARRLAVFHIVIVGFSLALVVMGIGLVRGAVVRPLRRLAEAAGAMAGGAYDRRIETHSADELGDLARAFNRMAFSVDEKTERLHALNEVALVVTSSLSLDEILDQIMLYGIPLSGARAVCIAFYDEATRRFERWVTRGLSDDYVRHMTFPPGGIGDEVVRRGDYILSNDLPGSFFPLPPRAQDEGIRSIVCLPLAGDKQCLGVIYFYRDNRDRFDFEEIELIRTFSRLAAHAIQNARLHALTVDLAETDALTGLYNRRKLEQRLREEIQRCQRSQQSVSLVAIDLDHFKNINDTHGHAAGDAALQTLASVFTREVRDIDLVARFGGEEFMLVLAETNSQDAWRVAERVRQAIAAHGVTLGNNVRLSVTASLGVACYPRSAGSAQMLMANADQAMYAAKRRGRNCTVLSSELLDKDKPERDVDVIRKRRDREA